MIRFDNKKGFTLIETLMAIVVFVVIMGAISAAVVAGYRNYRHIWQQSLVINEARRGMETMIKEIREARMGDDGSYPIALANDKEFVFYSDIDKDDEAERVRYFLGNVGSNSQTKECVTYDDGGSCSVVFSDFLSGTLQSATLQVWVEGDFGWSREYAELYLDGQYQDTVCRTGCSDCPASWQGTSTFDVTDLAADDNLEVLLDATSRVNDICDWIEPNHAMKVKVDLSWTEDLPAGQGELRKGVINPTGSPPQYPEENEEFSILSYYVHNSPPIFEYFDENGNKITDYPARLKETKMMKVFLVVDVDPSAPPEAFELESSVYLRNLKDLIEY